MKYLPREHGATAMAFTPIACVAILVRTWHWTEILLPFAVFCILAAKDPAVLVVRQRFLSERRHSDAVLAKKWTFIWLIEFVLCASVIVSYWPLRPALWMVAGIGCFAVLAIAVNVRNKQRSVLFQLFSGAALTSTALGTCLSATGAIAPWCWWFWGLSTLQAFAGILVVRARLDARLALRSAAPPQRGFRRAAFWSTGLLVLAAIGAAYFRKPWVAAALILACAAYANDLRAQSQSRSLQTPLKAVGQRSLTLSIVYSALLVVGLW